MIHVVLGTKAQLIKMAPLMRRMKDRGIPYRYISTGQHRDTMNEILDNFGLPGPDLRLYDGRDITSIPQMALWALRILWKTLFRRRSIFGHDRNGIVLVHGDTFSTALGALMGKFAGLQVGHVESGLRSFNIFQPFPEELTRLLTFAVSDVYFCPGQWALDNLSRYAGDKVDTRANTLVDALRYALPAIESLPNTDLPDGPYGVVTLHRFENFRDFESTLKVVEGVERVAKVQKLLFILHKPTLLNLQKHGLYARLEQNPAIELRPRYDYFRFMKILVGCEFVVSDGGSNQEECSYLGKPVLLFRNVSERQEGLGRNAVLSRFDSDVIDRFAREYPRYHFARSAPDFSPSDLIVDYCVRYSVEA